MAARWSSCAAAASKWSRPAIWCSGSKRCGTHTRSRRTATRRRRSIAIKDRAFELIAKRVRDGEAMTEFAIQQQMAAWFEEEGLVSDSQPGCGGAGKRGRSALPADRAAHAADSAETSSCCWICGRRRRTTRTRYIADITWVGFTGRQVPAEMAKAFEAIRQARDAAAALVQESAREQRDLRGWQVDRAARDVLERAGFGERILHRTGHNLGRDVHGNGVHMDDYESHDDRRLIPGTGFTIEPGLYFDSFGVRTEINMFYGEREALITGPVQTEIVTLT